MTPAAAEVLPLFDPVAGSLYDAIEWGQSYADDLLTYREDPWYWSHSA